MGVARHHTMSKNNDTSSPDNGGDAEADAIRAAGRIPHFDIPLNLPHAGTIAARIVSVIESRAFAVNIEYLRLSDTAARLAGLLLPYRLSDEDPDTTEEAETVRQEAARIGREMVDEIARRQLGEDRLGQCIRNLFECLEMGEEGALLSLRAGENPRSLQRPT